MHFADLGAEVAIVDNLSKRIWEAEMGVAPLFHIPTLQKRVRLWNENHRNKIALHIGDIAHNQRFTYQLFEDFRPDTVVHYAEQPSAPYSMHNRLNAVSTQINNVAGTLNVLFAMKHAVPHAHLVKLGTMGEYGTPNFDIEEGWMTIEHNGRRDRVLFPKRPGSFYHLSKVHDSHNIEFACRIWGLRATDLNQGVVYGIDTEQTEYHPELLTSFHYDEVFGTVLNRFATQAVAGIPLTVYGKGGQKRGFLNIRDTIACIAIAAENPPPAGEFRVFNQFTEQFTVNELAERVRRAGEALGLSVTVAHVENPRIEAEEHYYNAKNTSLLSLGLKPLFLTDEFVTKMLRRIAASKDQIDREAVYPKIKWHQARMDDASRESPIKIDRPVAPAPSEEKE